ncbi:hypothetical protein GCM10009808_09110 [Microbacterium sediminicola]|uniref:DUF1294 domain-containing protein n=1 Tax=Microbacterium sediminicola TaxID=415210 RepID=A0ABP4TWP6_9MICO
MSTGSGSAARSGAGTDRSRDLSTPLPAALSWTVLGVFAGVFVLASLVVGLPLWLAAVYLVMSVVAFAAYGLDKAAAAADRRRISEKTLLTLGVLCGWPGALIAQQVFRHKTRKRSFRRMFWVTVVLNLLVLVAVTLLVAMIPDARDAPVVGAL